MDPNKIGLPELERRLAHDLQCLGYPDADWVLPRLAPDGSEALDCAIIGAGQSGLALAAGLARNRVGRVVCFDAAPAGHEGPWASFARMDMLRTPKDQNGPDLGIASLSFRAWWEAQHGSASWEAMFRIPRMAWMDYLNWYRRVMGLQAKNGWTLVNVRPTEDRLLRLDFTVKEGGAATVYARTVALCTGGGIRNDSHAVPDFLAAAVPKHLRAHTSDDIDFAALRGKRVGILGAGASGFDNAIMALQHGATVADLCFRRAEMPDQNPRRWLETAGFLANFSSLPELQRWAYVHQLRTLPQGPPQPTLDKALSFRNFHMHPATPWDDIDCDGKTIFVRSGDRNFEFDFVISATGSKISMAQRVEYNGLLPHAAVWGDRFRPPPELENPGMSQAMFLGPFCELTEKVPGSAPWLSHVFAMGGGVGLRFGPVAGSATGLKFLMPRLVNGVTRALFLDQADATWEAFCTTDHTEIRLPARHMEAAI